MDLAESPLGHPGDLGDPGDLADLGTVVIAVLTYKRTEDLPVLLPLLAEQTRTIAESASVIIVDNDPGASARTVVADLALPEVTYVHEPAPGIASARNRALEEASARGTHLLAFIDDDERPEPEWLSAMVECYRRERCAAVAGVVIPDVGRIDDPWLRQAGFFVRKRHPTGSEQEAAATANLLLDLRQVEQLGRIRFDNRFGLTGGEDTLFTRTLTRRGGRIVWCDEAIVVDHIRVHRVTRRWILQRHFRNGNTWARIEVELGNSAAARALARLRMTLNGTVRIILGGLRAAVGVVIRSPKHQGRGSKAVARGVGMATGAWGAVYEDSEYRRKDDKQSSPV